MPRRPQDSEESKRIAINLGARVRTLRKSRSWTQSILSDLLGISTEAYGRIERGHALPSFPTFCRLCRILEATPNALLGECDGDGTACTDPEDDIRRRIAQLMDGLDMDALGVIEKLIRMMLRPTTRRR